MDTHKLIIADYGTNEEKRERREKNRLARKADENLYGQGSGACRDGDTRETGQDSSDRPDRPFKDTRKWRTETEEQAQ